MKNARFKTITEKKEVAHESLIDVLSFVREEARRGRTKKEQREKRIKVRKKRK